jgi:serine/threonine-protein kinase
VQRFAAEARIVGRLQHPAIPPVHGRGQLPDGRPFFTMKLIRGETLEELLQARQGPAQELPRFLAVFEQVCQAMAYAHSRGILHRDLKPHNVMVGAFGEVQLLDWGLAKELEPKGSEITAAPPSSTLESGRLPSAVLSMEETVNVVPGDDAAGLLRTQLGQAVGTLAYMPPEQARGEVERVDERSDVFGLGAILCEILTGKPPFAGSDSQQVFHKARHCDHAEALARLDGCTAEAELVHLAKACLAAEPACRPPNAGEVAEAVRAYRAGVEERLRAAERGRAAAQARAEEARKTAAAERRAQRLLAGAALAVLLLIVGIGSSVWWLRQRQLMADTASSSAMAEARLLLEQARAAPLADDGKLREALEAANRAEQLASTGGASAEVKQQAADLTAWLEREREAVAKDRRLLARLLEVHAPRDIPAYARDEKGTMLTLAEATTEEQFASAFRDWGLDVDAIPTTEAAARLRERPQPVVTEVIAALDEWAYQRRLDRRLAAPWQRVADLAAALDENPSSLRRQLRAILEKSSAPMQRALAKDRNRLHKLAEEIDPASEPVLALLTLTRALRGAGDDAPAAHLLREALMAHPREVVLYQTLGEVLSQHKPPQWREAVECYRVARVLRPDLGVKLALALVHSGRASESVALLGRMLREQPDHPYLHFHLGMAFHSDGLLAEAEAAYRQAIALEPSFAEAHNNLAHILSERGKTTEAEAACRKAIDLKPDLPIAQLNLGNILIKRGKPAQAEAASRRVLALDPDYAEAYVNLGIALIQQGKPGPAEEAYRTAIDLKPEAAKAHYNLGNLFLRQGKLEPAEAAYRKAMALEPNYIWPFISLGTVLIRQGKHAEAEAISRQAVALRPRLAAAHLNLASALNKQGKGTEAEIVVSQALALEPDYGDAYNNLGFALYLQGKLALAETAYRQALAHQPALAEAHYNLGIVLEVQGKLVQAADAYRQAIAFQPEYGEPHCNLGYLLRQQGRLVESLQAYRRGHEAGSKERGWNYPSLRWVREAERLVELANQLPAILQGEAAAGNAAEALILAKMCQEHRKLYAGAVHLYVAAFSASAQAAADLAEQNRYHAACSAVLAAAGQGEDARRMPDRVVVLFRRWALGWLRDDLAAYDKLANQGNATTKRTIGQRLVSWQRNPDLASVRDRTALDRLPDDDRAAWQGLWRDVDALLARTQSAAGDLQAPPVVGISASAEKVPAPIVTLRPQGLLRSGGKIKLRAAALAYPYAYGLGRFGGLWVFKLPTKEEAPGQELAEVGHVPAAGDGNALTVIGDTLLCTSHGGLEVFTLKDPARPRLLGRFGPTEPGGGPVPRPPQGPPDPDRPRQPVGLRRVRPDPAAAGGQHPHARLSVERLCHRGSPVRRRAAHRIGSQ